MVCELWEIVYRNSYPCKNMVVRMYPSYNQHHLEWWPGFVISNWFYVQKLTQRIPCHMTLYKCWAEFYLQNMAVPALNEFFIEGAVIASKEQRAVTAVRLEKTCYQCILDQFVPKDMCGSIPCEKCNCNITRGRLSVGRPIFITHLCRKDWYLPKGTY